jgi:hypothetical protein
MGRTTISLPGGFEPDSTVIVVIPIQNRSEPPTPDEFKDAMLGDRDNFEEGIVDRDRVDAIRKLEVNTNEVPNVGDIEIAPTQRRVEALVVELRTSITPSEARFIQDRMERELSSTFFIDTFSRIV